MKRLFVSLIVWLLGYGLVLAANLSPEQKEVQTFIKKLYSIDSLTFEMGEFSNKFDPKRQNELQAKFFATEIMLKYKTPSSDNGYVRHPSLDSQDLSQTTGIYPTKNPKMRLPVINGDQSYVDVYPDNGRTIYFLAKTPVGWRIINTASYDVWPRNDGSCWRPFYLMKPTPDQLALETKECIKYRKSESGIK